MTKDAKLIYLMDPQCGWCFGYSGTVQDIVAHFQDDERLELELVTGGLFHPARATGPEVALASLSRHKETAGFCSSLNSRAALKSS